MRRPDWSEATGGITMRDPRRRFTFPLLVLFMTTLIAASIMLGVGATITQLIIPFAADLAPDATRGQAVGAPDSQMRRQRRARRSGPVAVIGRRHFSE